MDMFFMTYCQVNDKKKPTSVQDSFIKSGY